MQLQDQQIIGFTETLWAFYAQSGRDDLAWRQPEPDGSFDPYKIMVSELMLQQTQVSRVGLKYHEFLSQFPDIASLAGADLGDVLRVWQGLGYNRRAKFLWQASQILDKLKYFPQDLAELVSLPGIGINTAGAIQAYAYNLPAVFIETNVRTVYIHHFFADHRDVSDADIRAVLEQTLDQEQPREFYWALMDYGSHLKATVGNLNKVSKHYTKQSKFQGSRRQIRGQVLRELATGNKSEAELVRLVADPRLVAVLQELTAEQLVRRRGGMYSL